MGGGASYSGWIEYTTFPVERKDHVWSLYVWRPSYPLQVNYNVYWWSRPQSPTLCIELVEVVVVSEPLQAKFIRLYPLCILFSYIYKAFNIFQVYQYLNFTIYRWYFKSRLEHFHEYLIQHPLKAGGTKDHCSRVKVPGTAPFWRPVYISLFSLNHHRSYREDM
jgi:hypothetical protein